MLFLLPFVSWYYLQSGLDWRKQAQVIMSGKQLFPEGKWIDQHKKIFSTGLLAEHVSIVSILTCENKDSVATTLSTFYRQFKETKKANFIILNMCDETPAFIGDTSKSDWFVFDCKDSNTVCNVILANWPSGKTHALIDRNKVIRAYYDEHTKDQKRVLLEHMALLLPRERSEHIELKRGDQR